MSFAFDSASSIDLDGLAQDSQHAVIVVSEDGQITAWNSAAAMLFGWSEKEAVGEALGMIFSPGDRESGIPASELSRARKHGCCDDTGWLLRKDGSRFWGSGVVLQLVDKGIRSFVKLVRDRTQEKLAEEALRGSEARHRRITETMPQLVWRSRTDGFWDWATPQWTLFTGQSEVDSLGYGWFEMVHPDDRTETERCWTAATEAGTEFEVEHRLRRADGEYRWFKTRAVPFREPADELGFILHWFGTSTDIHAIREAQDRILFLAYHDVLTGAANRILLHETLGRELVATSAGTSLAILYVDLDRFKECNDRVGYSGGDAVLKEVVGRLRSALSADDFLARVGGDEFVVLHRVDDLSEVEDFATALTRSVIGPLAVDGHLFHLGASIGVAVSPDDGFEADELLRRATVALSKAKGDGGAKAYCFEIAMDQAARARRLMLGDLDEAIEEGKLHLHYQPFFSLRSGKMRGFEALARWMHPRRGLVSPADFIPLAESSGRIERLGSWALDQACTAAASWPEPLAIAVNLSTAQFRGDGLVAQVAAALKKSGLPASRLELEVTESLLIEDTDRVLQTLRTLKETGLRIALDDFGTGYSSLSYLRRFPFDKVKIDQSFVKAMADDKASAAIVSAIVSLGHSLELTITAEGIENERQLELLRQAGCDEAQGYLLGVPSADISSAANGERLLGPAVSAT